ncbi:DNA topoisomerase-1 [Nocardiopsis flavescens]|uniref:DNA topoisomerase-1 n=1 Tax=Nocardiopsis flavescens TaxID=758803 RepID=A0A1M6NQC1_9ACTN|nr:hypothetical protein [Nocardiopsis flavescens]SHJ97937.1 DNA topoisomerase-1 [Nocardiopsis flavescens]
MGGDDLNAHLREVAGRDHTVKEFRTRPRHRPGRRRRGGRAPRRRGPGSGPEAHVVREAAHRLGDTGAVARESYIDPGAFRLYERGG